MLLPCQYKKRPLQWNKNKLAPYYMGPKHTGELWVYIGTPLPNPSGNTGVMVCVFYFFITGMCVSCILNRYSLLIFDWIEHHAYNLYSLGNIQTIMNSQQLVLNYIHHHHSQLQSTAEYNYIANCMLCNTIMSLVYIPVSCKATTAPHWCLNRFYPLQY